MYPFILEKPAAKLLTYTKDPVEVCAQAALTCTARTSKDYISIVKRICKAGHESVIEHASATFKIYCDRATANQIVRHRLCSYSQQSTRYVDMYTRSIPVYLPTIFREVYYDKYDYYHHDLNVWHDTVSKAFSSYRRLRENGYKPEVARAVLPHCLATELVMTANMRQWRHMFKLRLHRSAQTEIQEVFAEILKTFRATPDLFPFVADLDHLADASQMC